MVAQKTSAQIHTVEIDENAFELAYDNVLKSEFKNKIGVFHIDIQRFGSYSSDDLEVCDKYDLVFSNPPFFQKHLKGSNIVQNFAKHNDSLPLHELAMEVNRLLKKNGKFIVLLPDHEMNILENELAKFNLSKNQEIYIHHHQNSKVLRIIATFAYNSEKISKSDIYIKNSNNEYTDQFKTLLKDYYLIF